MINHNTVYDKPVRIATATILCAFILFCSLGSPAFSQTEATKVYRSLAPGVMKTIKPDFKFEETFTDKEIVELTSLGPEYNWAKSRFPNEASAAQTPFTCLEFQFKEPRIIEVNIPTRGGKVVKTPHLYVIYSVTNKKWAEEDAAKLAPLQGNLLTSDDLAKLDTELDFGSTIYVEETSDPIAQVDKGRRYQVKAGESNITFTPQFVIASDSLPFPKTEQYVLMEQISPLALPAIIKQEDPNRHFETSVSMADRQLKPGETVWGIAMWKDFDQDIKEFSIFVSGLSNAYLWNVDKERYQPGVIGSGYQMSRKTLKLNFWAPGAAEHLLNKQIRFGTKPSYTEKKRDPATQKDVRKLDPATGSFVPVEQKKQDRPPVDFEWVYR